MKGEGIEKFRVVRPWKDGWQLWEIANAAGSSWKRVGFAAQVSDLVCGECCVFLPAKFVPVVPLWVATADPEVVRESAVLQMEGLGLVSAGMPVGNIELDILEVFSERTLLRACVYPADFAVPARTDYYGFRPSPLGLHLPEDAITLWREGAFCVVAVTRGGAVVVWEAAPMPQEKEDERVFFGWFEAFCAEMMEGDFLGEPQFVLDYAGVMVRGGERVGSYCGMDVMGGVEEDGPPPLWPSDAGVWQPPGVVEARAALRRRQQAKRVAVMVGGFLVVLVAGAAGVAGWSHWKLGKLRDEVVRAERAAEPAMRVARDWEVLAPTILPERFVLEKLLLAVKALPADGVRFSLFEATEEGMRIEGEARNVGLATVYYNSLQAVEGANFYEWTMASPVLQPDNTARFAFEGRLRR